MKSTSLVLLLLIYSISVNAQQHEIPLPDSNAVWKMQAYIPPDPADPKNSKIPILNSKEFLARNEERR